MNPLRAIRCALIKRQIERACAQRKAARLRGETYVHSYFRKVAR